MAGEFDLIVFDIGGSYTNKRGRLINFGNHNQINGNDLPKIMCRLMKNGYKLEDYEIQKSDWEGDQHTLMFVKEMEVGYINVFITSQYMPRITED